MEHVKRGLILKDRVYVPSRELSYLEMLEELHIPNTSEPLDCVQVIITSPDTIFSDPDTWSFSEVFSRTFHVCTGLYGYNCDPLYPEWYDRDSAIIMFREAIKEWHNKYVLSGKNLVTLLDDGDYYLRDCNVDYITGSTVKILSGSGHVMIICSGSLIGIISGNLQIDKISGCSRIDAISNEVRVSEVDYGAYIRTLHNASIDTFRGRIEMVSGNSKINNMSAGYIGVVYDNSYLKKVSGTAIIDHLKDKSRVEQASGQSYIRVHNSAKVVRVDDRAILRVAKDYRGTLETVVKGRSIVINEGSGSIQCTNKQEIIRKS